MAKGTSRHEFSSKDSKGSLRALAKGKIAGTEFALDRRNERRFWAKRLKKQAQKTGKRPETIPKVLPKGDPRMAAVMAIRRKYAPVIPKPALPFVGEPAASSHTDTPL